jgi:hypothetical protein
VLGPVLSLPLFIGIVLFANPAISVTDSAIVFGVLALVLLLRCLCTEHLYKMIRKKSRSDSIAPDECVIENETRGAVPTTIPTLSSESHYQGQK